MKADTLAPETEAAVWPRVIHPEGELTPEAARTILRMSFPSGDIAQA